MKTTSPQAFDFTSLTNYVKPSETLEAQNDNWIDAKSTFHAIGEFHIFTNSCKRRDEKEIEIKRVENNLTNWQHDALHTHFSDLGISLDKDEETWLESIQPLVAFHSISITNRRGLAVVLNNTLYFLS